MDSVPYYEPALSILLPLSSFLLCLQILAYPFNLVSSGLLGQILTGVIFAAPLTSWLPLSAQEAIVQLGYIGLVLLCYEGGLTTDVKMLKQIFVPSVLVALTGICLPIALSFILIPLIPGTSNLTAFAAGAALSSTSLGTTFAVLASVKLNSTRLGTVLVTAAMIDDVIGLVLVRVISQLGGDVGAGAIARPIGVSIAFLVATILVSKIVKFGLGKVKRGKRKGFRFTNEVGFVATGGGLLGIGAAAGYAGTSILFAAYLLGVSAAYLIPQSSMASYQTYFGPVTNGLLLPFFFASIGFAIPIRQLFQGTIIWKGVIYTILMGLAKCLAGIWIMVLSPTSHFSDRTNSEKNVPVRPSTADLALPSNDTIPAITTQKANPVYPALLLGMAMTTRGEIGFLIAAVAQTAGVITPEEVYLVINWGIVLCTLMGPIGVGIIVRRIEKVGKEEVLGGWGELAEKLPSGDR